MQTLKVIKTKHKENPYFVESPDGLNQAFGKTKEQALVNLSTGMKNRVIGEN